MYGIDISTVKGVDCNWDSFREETHKLNGNWIYRGVLDSWSLEPSIERTARAWNVPLTKLPPRERELLREFKRAYPADAAVPQPRFSDDDLAWLALMQHYGAPTRLLDWTHSPFVAAFFALDTLLNKRKDGPGTSQAAVWALSYDPLGHTKARLPSSAMNAFKKLVQTQEKSSEPEEIGGLFRKLFLDARRRYKFVAILNSWHLHTRLRIQQGVFLCPGDITATFKENLESMPITSRQIRKFVLKPNSGRTVEAMLSHVLDSLHQMNISHSTLFPGIAGHAQRLHHRFEFLANRPHTMRAFNECNRARE